MSVQVKIDLQMLAVIWDRHEQFKKDTLESSIGPQESWFTNGKRKSRTSALEMT